MNKSELKYYLVRLKMAEEFDFGSLLEEDDQKEQEVKSTKNGRNSTDIKGKKKRQESADKNKEDLSNKLSYNIELMNQRIDLLVDEFNQLKRYFRGWNERQPERSYGKRPAQKKAIENFEKHLIKLK